MIYLLMKLTKEQLDKMTATEIADHLSDITQTEICKDESYCKMVVNIFLKK